MSELASRIETALQALATARGDEDLPLGHRRHVVAALPADVRVSLRLEVGVLRGVLAPSARKSEQGRHATKTIDALERVIAGGAVSKQLLRGLVDDGIALGESADGDAARTSIAFAAAAAASRALEAPPKAKTAAKQPKVDLTARDSSDPLDNDASFFAAAAHAGGPPASPGSDPERRRAFWTWWLTTLVPWTATADEALARPAGSASRQARRDGAKARSAPPATKRDDSRPATWRRGDDGVERLTIERVAIQSWVIADGGGILGIANAEPRDGEPFATEQALWSVDVLTNQAWLIARGGVITGVAADADRAYYWKPGGLHSADRRAGGSEICVAKGPATENSPNAVRVDDSSVYWLEAPMPTSALHVVDKGRGDARKLTELRDPRGLVVGRDHLYVSELDRQSSHGAGIVQISKSGRDARVIVAATTRRIALRGTELFWTEAQKSKTRIRSLQFDASAKPKPKPKPNDVVERTVVAGQFGASIPMDLLVTDEAIFIVDCRPGGHILRLVPPAKPGKPFTTKELARFGSFDRVELLGLVGGRLYVAERDQLARFDA